MSPGNLLFAVCSIVTLLGALVTVAAKSPIRNAMGLLAAIAGIAGYYLLLSAQFLAAIQLIVYAGAVVVLFVFVIMLLGPDASGSRPGEVAQSYASRIFGAALFGLLALLGFALHLRSNPSFQVFGAITPEHGSVEAVGREMFTRALVPFELATALLIVAVVGAIAIARSRHQAQKRKANPNPTARMFHGPVHPRDAGRPLPKGQPL